MILPPMILPSLFVRPMAIATPNKSPAGGTKKPERQWAPRFWIGCDFFGLMGLMARNRFAIHPALAYIAAIDLTFSIFNTGLRWGQNLVFGRRVAGTEIREHPIFVIGHWRSGTTLLHELLVLDQRFTYPTSYACFAPNHFLFTEPYAERWLNFLLPSHRPMDDMAMGWNSPQEDEFALCNLGIRSPYMTVAFPNHPPQCQEYFDLTGISPEARRRWQQGFVWFLKQITFRSPKRIVLKSPPHTCRIKALLEIFPDARFVHIVRNPYEVFFSSLKTWQRLYEGQGFQKPHFKGLEDHVFDTYLRMHRSLDESRPLLADNRFYELRFEDLVADPQAQLKTLYTRLELGNFDEVASAVQQYQAERSEYQAKSYQISPEDRRRISDRWGQYIVKYGYASETDRV